MRWSIAVLIALFAACCPVAGEACDCPNHVRAVRHHVVHRHVLYRHTVGHAYAGCPVALARWVRPGCDSTYRSYVDIW
jgi:hypothetical protein